LQGREAGHYAIVIEFIDDRHVLLADGEKRKVNSPKRKNRNYLEVLIAFLRQSNAAFWKPVVSQMGNCDLPLTSM